MTRRSLTAVFWSGVDIFLRQGLQFFVSILLARLLSPEDFGLLAMLYLFIGVAGLFIDSGFGSALVQRQNITVEDESTVFYFNLGVALMAALGLCWAAPWIAAFFEHPILKGLTYLMALNLFLGAFGSIQTVLLTRELDFKTLTKVGAVASLLSGVLAVVLAWYGFGVWSLALQNLASTVINVTLLWLWSPWRPIAKFSIASLRSLFRFGGFLLISGLLDTLYTRFYSVVIGKLFAARELGFYTRAAGTQQLPVNVLTGVLNRVAFPIFSAAASDKALLKQGMRKALQAIMLFNVPAMMGLMVTSEPLVHSLFGEKWLPSVPILQVLCLAGVLWPLHVINLNVLTAQGHSNLFFRIEIWKKLIGVTAVAIASFHGILAMAWSQVLVGVFAFLINAHYSGVMLDYGAWRQLRDIMPFAWASLIMAAVVWSASQALHWPAAAEFIASLYCNRVEAVNSFLRWPPAVELAMQTMLGATFYALACHIFRLPAYRTVWAIIARRSPQ